MFLLPQVGSNAAASSSHDELVALAGSRFLTSFGMKRW